MNLSERRAARRSTRVAVCIDDMHVRIIEEGTTKTVITRENNGQAHCNEDGSVVICGKKGAVYTYGPDLGFKSQWGNS